MDQICLLDIDPKFEDVKCPYIKTDEVTKSCKDIGCVMYREVANGNDINEMFEHYFKNMQEFKKELIISLDQVPANTFKKRIIEFVCETMLGEKHPEFMKYSNAFANSDGTKDRDY